MAYSDEPQVVAAKSGRKWLWLALPVLLVLLGGISVAALSGPLHDWRRQRTEHGPNHGSVYPVRIEGAQLKLEIARNTDGFPAVFLDPMPAAAEGLVFRYRILNGVSEDQSGWYALSWQAEGRYWLGADLRLHPLADYKKELVAEREGRQVWSTKLWSYGDHHHHHHH